MIQWNLYIKDTSFFGCVLNTVSFIGGMIVPYSLKYSWIKYFAVWLNFAQNKFSRIKFSWSSASPVCIQQVLKLSRDKIYYA